MADDNRIDQRNQTIHGSQTNIAGNVQGTVLCLGTFSGPVSIIETTKQEPVQNHKESKALLAARLEKQENEIATVEIRNIGQATATNIRISFASRIKTRAGVEGKSAPIPNSANIPPGESIFVPIHCAGWKEISVDMRWIDVSGEDNTNRSHIPLEPI